MNLSDYVKMDKGRSRGQFISFEKTGDTKYLRFMYESGGETIGQDIKIRRKFYNQETGKYEYDTPEGTLTCVLECIEYDADGSNPRRVRWERSAYFCANTLIPMWSNYPRIMDGVWKVTATNPRTRDATYTLFPVTNADTIKYPIDLPDEPAEEKVPPKKKEPKPAAPAKKYWE